MNIIIKEVYNYNLGGEKQAYTSEELWIDGERCVTSPGHLDGNNVVHSVILRLNKLGIPSTYDLQIVCDNCRACRHGEKKGHVCMKYRSHETQK